MGYLDIYTGSSLKNHCPGTDIMLVIFSACEN